MVRFRWFSLIVIALIAVSCRNKLPELQGIDAEVWLHDKNGCNNKRSSMITALETEKDKLLTLTEMEIIDLLGRPDQNELSKRNQKFYYYYINPGPACDATSDASAKKLSIRFNAMGLAKEVAIEGK